MTSRLGVQHGAKKSGKVTWSTTEGWDVRSTKPAGRGRRSATEAADPFLANLTATPKTRRGEAAPAPLTLEVEGGPDDLYVVMTRYDSGAIRFHMPTESPRRGARHGARRIYRFSIPAPAAPVADGSARRGFISRAGTYLERWPIGS